MLPAVAEVVLVAELVLLALQLIRYGKALGEPGRRLVQTGAVTWGFPKEAENGG